MTSGGEVARASLHLPPRAAIIDDVDDVGGTPDEIRARCREARRRVSPDDRQRAANEVAERLAEVVGDRRPGRLGSYLPTDGELDPTVAAESLRSLGWRVYLPTIGEARAMSFAEWSADTPLVENRFAILEPAAGGRVEPSTLDVVLVPCVAADTSGNRLGFGAGYYDRAFAADARSTTVRPLLVGVVFDVQIAARLPAEPWDVPLDIVLTESMTITTRTF